MIRRPPISTRTDPLFPYTTLFRPDPDQLSRPVYLSLAEQIARAISEGALPHGTRLPTHRRMADDLSVSVQTVSRAYDELIRRGLISGERSEERRVGKGCVSTCRSGWSADH